MDRTRAFPPQPSVEHLTTIFRRIESSKIVVPAFQRAFVWDRQDVLQLLDSVYAGYPIGSVLLWAVDKEFLRLNTSSEVPFPKASPEFPASYVLDGLQRLSSLYGVFHFQDKTNEQIFDVSFDLESELFVPTSELSQSTVSVPLNALFNPRRLLDVQRRIIDDTVGDELLSKLTDLQARFQEYMIPLVTLANRELDEVVVIFERVNSTGTRLSRVDFMRAITWSAQFDLNQALEIINAELESEAFDVSDDTLVKALGLVFDFDPIPDNMLALRQRTPRELDDAVIRTIDTFKRVFAFLRQKLAIYSREFIPYEGQLLVLFRLFRDRTELNALQSASIRAWFFYISFEEVLQGRPDNFVARLIRSVESQIDSGHIDVPTDKIDAERFVRRRMLKGKALTTAFVTMMAELQPRGLLDVEVIDPAQLTGSYDSGSFLPILNMTEMVAVRGQLQSVRTPANVLIVSQGERLFGPDGVKRFILAKAAEISGQDYLDRQLISQEAVEALVAGDNYRFIEIRSALMADRASAMIKV